MTSMATSSSAPPRTVLAVIVSHKSSELVKNLLASLAHERPAEAAHGITLRAVVIDNASDDAGPIQRAVVAAGQGDWVTVISAARNGGFAYGNNVGFRHGFAQATVPDFFYLLNPDTEVRGGAIGALVDFFDRHADAGIAGSSLEFADGRPWPFAFRFPSLLGELDHGLRLGLMTRLLRNHIVTRPMGSVPEPVDWMPGASMMVRRKVIEDAGGMDEAYFLYYEETDHCRKVKAAGFTIWYVPESRVMHIGGQSTGVTTQPEVPRRLPAYWYESRRRYFAKNHGVPYAMATDAVLLLAHLLGHAKERLKTQRHAEVPYFARDVLHHSVLRKANRTLVPAREWKPNQDSK
jgi:hypothetical protein